MLPWLSDTVTLYSPFKKSRSPRIEIEIAWELLDEEVGKGRSIERESPAADVWWKVDINRSSDPETNSGEICMADQDPVNARESSLMKLERT